MVIEEGQYIRTVRRTANVQQTGSDVSHTHTPDPLSLSFPFSLRPFPNCRGELHHEVGGEKWGEEMLFVMCFPCFFLPWPFWMREGVFVQKRRKFVFEFIACARKTRATYPWGEAKEEDMFSFECPIAARRTQPPRIKILFHEKMHIRRIRAKRRRKHELAKQN